MLASEDKSPASGQPSMEVLRMPDRESNRLTDDDRNVIRARITETVTMWRQAGARLFGAVEVDACERIGWHAIGCDSRDLRAVEEDEIRDIARDVLFARTDGR